jgi:hypothetical protein
MMNTMKTWLQSIKILFLLSALAAIFTHWYQLRVSLDSKIELMEQKISSFLKDDLNLNLNQFKKERVDRYPIIKGKKKDSALGLTAVSCDENKELNAISLYIEGQDYKKFIMKSSHHFPPFHFFLHEEGKIQKTDSLLYLISNDGETMEVLPLQYFNKGGDLFQGLNYYGRPMHGLFCRPEQVSSIERHILEKPTL